MMPPPVAYVATIFHEEEVRKRLCMERQVLELEIQNLELEVAVVKTLKRLREKGVEGGVTNAVSAMCPSPQQEVQNDDMPGSKKK